MKIPAIAVLLTATLFGLSCTSAEKEEAAVRRAEPEAASPSSSSVKVDTALTSKLGIEVQRLTTSPANTAITAGGRLQNDEDASWQVGAMTDGRIISVPVAVGDRVRLGQVLAVLHSHDVHDARASYRQAKAELQRHKILSEQALTVRDRTRRLFELRAASREQLEAAEAAYRNASASVATAEAEVEKAEFHLTDFLEVPLEAEGHADHASSRDGLTIKAPASGTLMERKVTAGSVVSTGDPVFVIADLAKLWMIAAVNEADMAHVHPGQRVEIRVRAFPDRTFTGRVLRLGERLDPQTRTLQVRVAVPNSQGLLKPEMFANATFAAEAARNVLQLPESAIHRINGKTMVFLEQSPGSFNAREVSTGATSQGQVEIVSGLQAGDAVVIKGGFLLRSQLAKATGD